MTHTATTAAVERFQAARDEAAQAEAREEALANRLQSHKQAAYAARRLAVDLREALARAEAEAIHQDDQAAAVESHYERAFRDAVRARAVERKALIAVNKQREADGLGPYHIPAPGALSELTANALEALADYAA